MWHRIIMLATSGGKKLRKFNLYVGNVKRLCGLSELDVKNTYIYIVYFFFLQR